MLKNSSLPTVAALGLCAALAFAQEAPSVAQEPVPERGNPGEFLLAATDTAEKPSTRSRARSTEEAPVPEIISTPVPKKRNFLQRLFGPRNKKPEATPTPEPTSTPTPTPRKSARKSEEPAAKKDEPSKTAPEKKSEVPAVASPTPAKTEAKLKPAVAEMKKPVVAPLTDAERDAKEKTRFDQAKDKAAEDPQVKALKSKADNASTDEESRKTLRAYNKALFEKIRKIDSSVSDRATRLEAAILKRLNE